MIRNTGFRTWVSIPASPLTTVGMGLSFLTCEMEGDDISYLTGYSEASISSHMESGLLPKGRLWDNSCYCRAWPCQVEATKLLCLYQRYH
jgi:hypothetical protein